MLRWDRYLQSDTLIFGIAVPLTVWHILESSVPIEAFPLLSLFSGMGLCDSAGADLSTPIGQAGAQYEISSLTSRRPPACSVPILESVWAVWPS